MPKTKKTLPNVSSDTRRPDPHKDLPSIQALYQKVAPVDFIGGLLQRFHLRRNNGVFTLPVVLWLMIYQRLDGKGTLFAAVQHLVCGLPAGMTPKPSKRLSERTISGNTGGYNQARHKLPLKVAEQVFDHAFDQLMAQQESKALRGCGLRVFVIDGATLLLRHTPELVAAYPPSRNQFGESHWPVMRVVVAHELSSGIAMRPHSGPVNGPKAASEQRLIEACMSRLPAGSALIGDRNFGVFSVAYEAQRQNHPVLLRMTSERAKHAFGLGLNNGTDRPVAWTASRYDRARHPDLPADACVHGRLLARRVYPSDGSGPVMLYLFTTLDLPEEDIVKLYGQRWNIETDLRTVKKTIRLEMLESKTPEMAAKELVLAIMAYNLVRAVIAESARRTQLDPRGYSFSRVQDVLNTWLPYLDTLSSEEEFQAEYERMMKYVAQCRLYKRKKPKSYPREVWGRPQVFPRRKATAPRKPASTSLKATRS